MNAPKPALLKDLGWGNGWNGVPELVRNCAHEVQDLAEPGSCVHRVTCTQCGYTYQYDSGD
jgi:hypothetical protein